MKGWDGEGESNGKVGALGGEWVNGWEYAGEPPSGRVVRDWVRKQSKEKTKGARVEEGGRKKKKMLVSFLNILESPIEFFHSIPDRRSNPKEHLRLQRYTSTA